MVGSCEHGNETSGFIKGKEFLDWLSDYQFLKKYALSSTLLKKSEITRKNNHEF